LFGGVFDGDAQFTGLFPSEKLFDIGAIKPGMRDSRAQGSKMLLCALTCIVKIAR
jgi:hypothetical protein